MGLSHGTPQSGRFYPGLEAERKADTLLTHAPGPPGPWPDRALLSSLGRVGPGLTLPGEACPIPRLGACNEKWVSREARRGAQSQAWRPSREGRDLVCPGTPSSTIPCPCPTLRASHSVSKLSSHPPALHQPPPHSPPFLSLQPRWGPPSYPHSHAHRPGLPQPVESRNSVLS